MNIAIIFHSSTGTTKKFAEKISDALRIKGNTVDTIQLKTDVPINSGSVRSSSKFKITNLPDIKKYDVILTGGPVWAFSASPVIIKCIENLNFAHKKVLPFVTMGFPFRPMGGNQAIALMSKVAIKKDATVLPGVIVPKLFHDINKEMAHEIETIIKTIQK